jgi:hypothetical protein
MIVSTIVSWKILDALSSGRKSKAPGPAVGINADAHRSAGSCNSEICVVSDNLWAIVLAG